MSFEKIISEFDLSSGSLNEYKVGSLAPRNLDNKHYHNYQCGYSISVIENQISSILVCFKSGYRKFCSYDGIVKLDGNDYAISDCTTVEEIVSILGQPITQWNDGVELGLDYCINGRDVEIIWHVDGESTLEYISVEV